MNISLTDPAIAVHDAYTVLPANDEGMPMRDLVYAHQLGPVRRTTRRKRAVKTTTTTTSRSREQQGTRAQTD